MYFWLPLPWRSFFFAPCLRLACEITGFTHAESVQTHAGACALCSKLRTLFCCSTRWKWRVFLRVKFRRSRVARLESVFFTAYAAAGVRCLSSEVQWRGHDPGVSSRAAIRDGYPGWLKKIPKPGQRGREGSEAVKFALRKTAAYSITPFQGRAGIQQA